MTDCCSHTDIAQVRALLDISVMRYAIVDLSEGKEQGCSSMREHYMRIARQVPDSPAKCSGEVSGALEISRRPRC
jgi:hypothetical protein